MSFLTESSDLCLQTTEQGSLQSSWCQNGSLKYGRKIFRFTSLISTSGEGESKEEKRGKKGKEKRREEWWRKKRRGLRERRHKGKKEKGRQKKKRREQENKNCHCSLSGSTTVHVIYR